jgi:hypothetical protein
MLVHPTGQGDEEKGKRSQPCAHGRRLSRHCASDFSNAFNPFEFLHVTGFEIDRIGDVCGSWAIEIAEPTGRIAFFDSLRILPIL